jgi:hypothetical protein
MENNGNGNEILKRLKSDIEFYEKNVCRVTDAMKGKHAPITDEQIDQPEWCSEDIKIEHKPVLWMIIAAVVAGLGLFLVRSC